MKAILVPVGSSSNAKSHLEYAIDFAKAFAAKIYVVQIYNVYTKAGTLINVDSIVERGSREFLKSHLESVDHKGVEISGHTIKGDLIDAIEHGCKEWQIDLILVEPRTNSIKDELYLDKTSGKIIKRTEMPALIVPEGYKFKPIVSILIAVKSAVVRKEEALIPLMEIKNRFKSILNLLLVKTPYYKDGDFDVPESINELISKTRESENPTTFQGVLERYQEFDPDLLCVVRRRRGFFNKLWEEDTILKKDFHSRTMPVLVLSGLK